MYADRPFQSYRANCGPSIQQHISEVFLSTGIYWRSDDARLMELAQAEAKVIADYFGVTKKLYRLQLGAFRNKEYAQNFLDEINEAVKKLDVKAFIVED